MNDNEKPEQDVRLIDRPMVDLPLPPQSGRIEKVEPLTRAAQLDMLRKEFKPQAVGKLFKAYNAEESKKAPRVQCKVCGNTHSSAPGVHLEYVGHAAVTDRLLAVDPLWNWEPVGHDKDGAPVMIRNQSGRPIGMWIRLTVLGVTRLGYGSVGFDAFEPEKQLIGDALRNAAMRFGVALDLWTKDELESSGQSEPAKTLQEAVERTQQPADPRAQPQAADAPAGQAAPPAQPPPAEDISGLIPKPCEGAPPLPQKGPGGTYMVYDLPVRGSVFDYAPKWDSWEVTSKDPDINKKYTWKQMGEGSVGGRRERWLRGVIGYGRAAYQSTRKIALAHERAATILWHLENERFLKKRDEQTAPRGLEVSEAEVRFEDLV